jgi:hypothetical protein
LRIQKIQHIWSINKPTKIGENVIFSFLDVSGCFKITLSTNFDEHNFHSKTVLLVVNFYPDEGFIAKNSDHKILRYSPFNLRDSAKIKTKLVIYHSKIFSGSSVPEVMSWKSCLGSPALESYTGNCVL